jgi:hypothetical protein
MIYWFRLLLIVRISIKVIFIAISIIITFILIRTINNKRNQYIIILVCLAVMLNSGYKNYKWSELYKSNAKNIEIAQQYGQNNDCIFIYTNNWKIPMDYRQFLQFQNIIFIPHSNIDILYQEEFVEYDSVVIFIDSTAFDGNIAFELQKIVDQYPNISSITDLYTSNYNRIFYLE